MWLNENDWTPSEKPAPEARWSWTAATVRLWSSTFCCRAATNGTECPLSSRTSYTRHPEGLSGLFLASVTLCSRRFGVSASVWPRLESHPRTVLRNDSDVELFCPPATRLILHARAYSIVRVHAVCKQTDYKWFILPLWLKKNPSIINSFFAGFKANVLWDRLHNPQSNYASAKALQLE